MYKLINISKAFAEKQVLSSINLSLNYEIVALIGENGAGKTTLLKIMLGKLEPDQGQVSSSGSVVGYVPQHPNFGLTIADCFDPDIEQWRIDIALGNVDLDKPLSFVTSKLSGGQKTRLSIAIVLAQNPTPNVLLLDEPTNNLDVKALDWLEKFVKEFRGSVVIVSHDRNFINKTCTKVLELKGGRLTSYSGNYDGYKAAKELEHQHAVEAYETNQAQREHAIKLIRNKSELAKTGKRTNRWPRDNDKAQNDWHKDNAQRSFAAQLKAAESRLAKIGEVERPENLKSYALDLGGHNHESKLIAKLDDVSVLYAPALQHLSFEIRGNERIQISGLNGTGKSTLLRVIAGLITPTAGSLEIGTNVTVGYLSQDVDGLDHSISAFDNLESTDAKPTDIYREARALGLDEKDLRKKPAELSRGQQTKLSFVKLLLAEHDLLIMDEPTNHLDIASKESIEAALHNYRGAMLIASHDDYFVKNVGITSVINLRREK